MIIMVPQLEIQKHYKTNENKISRVLENQNLQLKITSTDFLLEKSAKVSPINDSLCPCVIGGKMQSGGVNICVKNICTANIATDFTFYDSSANPLTALAGPTTAPVYYDLIGAPCSPDPNKNITCAYQSSVKFTAHCPGNLPSCDHADYLAIELSLTPVGTQFFSESKKVFIYPVNLNYQPFIAPIPNQTLPLPFDKKIPINANSGDASESQNFIFETCSSSDTSIVEIHCYKFINSIGQIILTPKSAGVAKISLQINDGGLENNLSQVFTFDATAESSP